MAKDNDNTSIRAILGGKDIRRARRFAQRNSRERTIRRFARKPPTRTVHRALKKEGVRGERAEKRVYRAFKAPKKRTFKRRYRGLMERY